VIRGQGEGSKYYRRRLIPVEGGGGSQSGNENIINQELVSNLESDNILKCIVSMVLSGISLA